MNETDVMVVGNIVNSPQRSRLPSGDSVTNFRVASTSRRFDKETQAWVDHRSFFVDVECWGELGGNVSRTLTKGDPVVVKGELYTHSWDSDQGRRSRPQVRAAHVGPDLARGVADFRRSARPAPPAEPDAGPDSGPDGGVDGGPDDALQDGLPADPFADRSTDYEGGAAALHPVDADAPADSIEREPSLT